jgi:hypothetical protein
MSANPTSRSLAAISEESLQVTSKEASADNSLLSDLEGLHPIYEEEDDYSPHRLAALKQKRRFSTNSTAMSDFGDRKTTSEVVKGPCSCSGNCRVF